MALCAAEPLTLGGVVRLLSLVVTAASFVPARRAVEVEPVARVFHLEALLR